MIQPNQELQIQRVEVIDPGIEELIHSEDEGDWTINVLKRHICDEDFYLFVGVVDGKPVTIVSLKVMDGYSRVDDMVTHAQYRGHGYGRSIVHHLVNYHPQVSKNQLYLYADNPIALRMYQDAGFVPAFALSCWVAWKD
jgi:ribosomal protein S18 acetylase RimI-like enzyme